MKKVKKRISLDELKLVSNVVSRKQQKMLVGGLDISSLNFIGGGSAVSYDWGGDVGAYTMVYTPDGRTFLFEGVSVSNGSITPNGAGCQYGGTVYGGNTGLTINDFIHEYGHRLQEIDMGTVGYGAVISESALKSSGFDWLVKKIYGSDSYYGTGYEYDASYRGNQYMDTYYPNSGYTAPTY